MNLPYHLPRSVTGILVAITVVLALLPPRAGLAAEPIKASSQGGALDLTLPIHQKPKLHSELSDPVLGDQAQIVEWSWSPQYAKRFGLPVQADGLADGRLWLVGLKVMRMQVDKYQKYNCRIVGLIDNKAPILMPPGDRFVQHPSGSDSIPRTTPFTRGAGEQLNYVPAQAAWFKRPKSKMETERPETGLGTPYLVFHRFYSDDLAYFELSGACAYFRDPEVSRNELRFPTRIDGKNDADKTQHAVYEASALQFNLPDNLMRRIYPYIRDADDWTSCLLRRSGAAGIGLSLRAIKSRRFGAMCEPAQNSGTR